MKLTIAFIAAALIVNVQFSEARTYRTSYDRPLNNHLDASAPAFEQVFEPHFTPEKRVKPEDPEEFEFVPLGEPGLDGARDPALNGPKKVPSTYYGYELPEVVKEVASDTVRNLQFLDFAWSLLNN
ncbi:uncharacterized protein LOC106652503 [Trichogramma pretiosum]|uniref:uncharacterized protein LOC106652503 n=1 Tax=Trichogramma pretiosum TaxID=7493 RepID=UPI0006C9C6CB|nr:uncharacterized protein LOC106652503 [Trichogramma pretiosum]